MYQWADSALNSVSKSQPGAAAVLSTVLRLIKDAMEIARAQNGFTIFALVDALTKLSQKSKYAGDRTELDARIGQLLAMAV